MKRLYLEVFSEFPGVKGFFATKYGASKGSPYYHKEVLEQQGLSDMQLIWPQQIHKDHIEVIRSRGSEPVKLPDTDGLITNVPGILLTTVHADCLPVFFFDSVKRAIGLVHAGWRGTAAGIASKAAAKMKEIYNCVPSDIQVFVGPGISSCCFETGPEVYQEFQEKWSFTCDFARKAADKYYIDLKQINKRQLTDQGILPENIRISSHCTCCEPELFCSYRREGGTYWRMGAGLCLIEKDGGNHGR